MSLSKKINLSYFLSFIVLLVVNPFKQNLLAQYLETKHALETEFTKAELDGGRWTSNHPRMLADVTGDGKPDIVGFGQYDVRVSKGKGDGTFEASISASTDFGVTDGWSVQSHVRTVADVNGDGRADIVAFGIDRVYVALGQTNGTFANKDTAHEDFSLNDGWSVQSHVRTVADVNGDGRADIVAFGIDRVYVALGQTNGTFGKKDIAHEDFSLNDGWSVQEHLRTLADVNGDNRADIVAFGPDQVFVALANQNGTFAGEKIAHEDFALNDGWTTTGYVRKVADVNNDNRADIVAFGAEHVMVALGNTHGTFGTAESAYDDFTQYWNVTDHVRTLADLDGNGLADIVGFGNHAVWVALASQEEMTLKRLVLTSQGSYDVQSGKNWYNSLSRANKDRALAMVYAPSFRQHYDNGTIGGAADLISSVNFDGDWEVSNNWQAVVNREKHLFDPSVYYTVMETKNYWFINFYWYHARDYANLFVCEGNIIGISPTDQVDPTEEACYAADFHVDDLEGVGILVNKPKSSTDHWFGMYNAVSSIFHSEKDVWLVDEIARQNDPAFHGPSRLLFAAETHGHGVTPRKNQNILGYKHYSALIETGQPYFSYYVVPNRNTVTEFNNNSVAFRLVDIFDSNEGLWKQRNNDKVFDRKNDDELDNDTFASGHIVHVGNDPVLARSYYANSGIASAPWNRNIFGGKNPHIYFGIAGEDASYIYNLYKDPEGRNNENTSSSN